MPYETGLYDVKVAAGEVELLGELKVPIAARGVVLFAHGSGSSRFSPRNQYVARMIREKGVGTLLFDLLTPEEESVDTYTRHIRFDIGLLSERLVAAAEWLGSRPETKDLSIGFFGASTGGGVALVAAAELGSRVAAVVSRGGRPDLAGDALEKVVSPVLLIVGGSDEQVIKLNEEAISRLRCRKELKIIPGATHLFEEFGKLEIVAQLAADWFVLHMGANAARAA